MSDVAISVIWLVGGTLAAGIVLGAKTAKGWATAFGVMVTSWLIAATVAVMLLIVFASEVSKILLS